MRLLAGADPAVAVSPRARLLAEAFVLFYEEGIRPVGIDLLIARAGVAKASFYRHFPAKTELVDAYLVQRQEAWTTWFIDALAARATSAEAQLFAVFDVLTELFEGPGFNGCPMINAVCELGNANPFVLVHAQAHREAIEGHLRKLADDAGAENPGLVAEQLNILIAGAIVMAQRSGGSDAADVSRQAAAAVLDLHLPRGVG